jgi:hypothetical protein
MKKTCDSCGLEEVILIMSVYWAGKVWRFVRCVACNHEQYYECDEK